MARGVKKLSLDEQLDKITKEIENMKSSLAELENTKREIEEQIRQNRLVELDEIISGKGLSFDEVRELLCKE